MKRTKREVYEEFATRCTARNKRRRLESRPNAQLEEEEGEEIGTKSEGGGRDDADDGRLYHVHVVRKQFTETSMWTARDGSRIDFGSINPDDDFWHPEGYNMFEGHWAEDLCYAQVDRYAVQGHTTDRIYRCAVLVIWPRSQALDMATGVGFAALQSLLNLRMQDAAALHASSIQHFEEVQQQQQQVADDPGDSILHELQEVRKDVAAVLDVCVSSLQRKILQEASSSKQVSFVLQQAVQAVQLGVTAAVQAVQRLVAAVATSPKALLRDNATAAALAAAAGELSVVPDNGLGVLLQQLVSSCIAAHPSSCINLISWLSSQPELQQQLADAVLVALDVSGSTADALVPLVAAVPALPAVQKQIVDSLITAVRQDSSAQFALQLGELLYKLNPAEQQQHRLTAAVAAAVMAAGPAANLNSCIPLLRACKPQPELLAQFVQAVADDLPRELPLLDMSDSADSVWQFSTVAQLLQDIQDTPASYWLLSSAVAERLFNCSELLSAQTDCSMLQLSEVLLANVPLSAVYYGPFAAAVVQRPHSYKLLKRLLRSGLLQAHLDVPQVQQLVSCQVAHLEHMSTVPPFSWCMPEARLPAAVVAEIPFKRPLHSQVEAFLRGPEETLTLSAFSSMREACGTAEAFTKGCSLLSKSSSSWYDPAVCVTDTYSLTVDWTGIGQQAQVVICKTQDWYDSVVRGKKAYEKKLQAVKALQR